MPKNVVNRPTLKILCLDYEFFFETADFEPFASDTSCFDYDLVIWDPGEALDSYEIDSANSEYMGLPNLDSSSSVRSQADIARRRSEFKEFVSGGRVLVIIARPPQRFYYDTGANEYSGSGRTRQMIRKVDRADFWSAAPFPIVPTVASGSKISFTGPAEFAPFWGKRQKHFRYEAYFDVENFTPIMKIPRSEKVVGAVRRFDSGGTIVLLPALRFQEPDKEESGEGYADPADIFEQALVDLARTLLNSADAEPRPEWATHYHLSGEAELRDRLVDQEQTVQNERTKLAALQADLDHLESRMILITGSGRQLELQVGSVLEKLGGTISEPDPGRADWKVTFPEGVAVVEVKGVNGSAGEKNAAQLEKWVSGHIEETDDIPKGLLIVNGWRHLPIEDRNEPVFPNQMLAYSTQRNHCLVTGQQMLGILQDVEQHPDRAQHWRDRLLSTAGILPGFEDWSTVVMPAPRSKSEKKSAGEAHSIE